MIAIIVEYDLEGNKVTRRFTDYHRMNIFVDRCLLEGKKVTIYEKKGENFNG